MTPVSEIYSRLSVIISDKTYCKLPDEDIEFIFKRFLENAIVMFKELNKQYKPKVIEDDYGESYLIKTKNIVAGEEDFDLEEQEILCYGMLIAWHETQIFRDEFLKQGLNTKDFNRLSNATMLANNIALHSDVLRKELLKKRRRYRNRDWSGDDF